MFKLILIYANATLVFICMLLLSIEDHAAVFRANTIVYAIEAILFAGLALYVYSFGLLISPGQFFYGLFKSFFSKEKKVIYIHHLVSGFIACLSFALIFSFSNNNLKQEGSAYEDSGNKIEEEVIEKQPENKNEMQRFVESN